MDNVNDKNFIKYFFVSFCSQFQLHEWFKCRVLKFSEVSVLEMSWTSDKQNVNSICILHIVMKVLTLGYGYLSKRDNPTIPLTCPETKGKRL